MVAGGFIVVLPRLGLVLRIVEYGIACHGKLQNTT